jgi:hypothetical protein
MVSTAGLRGDEGRPGAAKTRAKSMTAILAVKGAAAGRGDDTLVTVATDATVTSGHPVDTADGEVTYTAIGQDEDGAVAATDLWGLVYVEGDDGEGAAVEPETNALAAGETAIADSDLWIKAIATPGADVAIGRVKSYASGDEFHDADASVTAYGDITAGGGSDVDTENDSTAMAVGVAVDLPDSP